MLRGIRGHLGVFMGCFMSQGPGRKPGASLYTRKRFSLSLFICFVSYTAQVELRSGRV